MKECYIIINGKRIDLVETENGHYKLDPEQLANLEVVAPKKSPFERVEDGEDFYYICAEGEVAETFETGAEICDRIFAAANYCTDREVLKQRALYEILNRRLWRYSMEHDGESIDWNSPIDKYAIYYNYETNRFCIIPGFACQRSVGTPFFQTAAIADGAIEEVVEPFMAEHPEFKW